MFDKDKTNPKIWEKKITLGKTVFLKDEKTLEENKMQNLECTITQIQRIKETEGRTKWIMLTLDDGDPQGDYIYMLAVISGKTVETFILREPPKFESGNREDMMDGKKWIFARPEDLDNFDPDDPEQVNALNFTTEIPSEEISGTKGITYTQIFDESYGECTEDGSDEKMVATVAQYRADEDCDNPELFVVEIGAVAAEEEDGEEGEDDENDLVDDWDDEYGDEEEEGGEGEEAQPEAGGSFIIILWGKKATASDFDILGI